jgi:hypothetical protein
MSKHVDDLIRQAGWFEGTEEDWWALPEQERHDRAFAATGCEIAYPSWPRDDWGSCLHVNCRIRRGELPRIAAVNRVLQAEMTEGWLRLNMRSKEGRKTNAAISRAVRKMARETGIYDAWQFWPLIVYGGLGFVEAARSER